MVPVRPRISVPEGWRYVIYAENQKEYAPLPAFLEKSEEGHVVTCWKLAWKERARILLSGKLWLTLRTFHRRLQPSMLTTKCPIELQ